MGAEVKVRRRRSERLLTDGRSPEYEARLARARAQLGSRVVGRGASRLETRLAEARQAVDNLERALEELAADGAGEEALLPYRRALEEWRGKVQRLENGRS